MTEVAEKMQELVERFIDLEEWPGDSKRKTAITRITNTLLRNDCESMRDIYLKDEFKWAGKGTKTYAIIMRMKQEYSNDIYKRQRLAEIDMSIRKLSEERKMILMDMES